MNLESVNIILITALIIATVLLTIIGVQLILVIREIYSIVRRANNVIKSAERVTNLIVKSSSSMEGAIQVVSSIAAIVKKFKKKDKQT